MPVDPIPQLVEISEKDTDMELNAFFLAVDSLNDNYLPYTTRTNIRKWGSRFLSAVVDASVGAVASAATTPIGGTIIGTGASWAYEEVRPQEPTIRLLFQWLYSHPKEEI